METRHWAEVLYNHIYVYIIFIMIIIITIKIVNKLWICVSITIAIFHCKIKSSIKKKYFTVQYNNQVFILAENHREPLKLLFCWQQPVYNYI